MKLRPSPNRERGNLLLAIIALIALLVVVYVGYKLIERLQQWQPDPNHGQGTNAVDVTMINTLSNLTASYGPLRLELPEFNLTLPAEALGYQWNYDVETSTNLLEWHHSTMEWEEALDAIRTNHDEPQRYYRRILWW